MKDFEKFSLEELKTIAGCVMSDLGGDWLCNNIERIEYLLKVVEELKDRDFDVQELDDVCLCALNDVGEDYDGKVWRGQYLYKYVSFYGVTKKVMQELMKILNHPEYNITRILIESE